MTKYWTNYLVIWSHCWFGKMLKMSFTFSRELKNAHRGNLFGQKYWINRDRCYTKNAAAVSIDGRLLSASQQQNNFEKLLRSSKIQIEPCETLTSQLINPFYQMPLWWSCGQRACLLFQRVQIYNFSAKNVASKERKQTKRGQGQHS